MSYTKQEWVNNVSDVDEEKMNHIEDGIFNNSIDISNLKNRSAISVGLSDSITLSTTGENTLNLNRIISQIGTGLTLSNGKVYVGSGINYVLISGSVYTNRSSAAGAACNVYVKTNNAYNAVVSTNNVPSGQSNHTTTTPLLIIPTNEGDYFTLHCYGYSGDIVLSYIGTCLTVLAVK